MSGKKSRKENPVHSQKPVKPVQAAAKKAVASSNTGIVRGIQVLLLALVIVLYGNTLGHDYALDDYSVILENSHTKAGTGALKEIFTSGYRADFTNGDKTLYRPLSKAMLAIEWSFSPKSPGLNHFMNVLLFAITGILLFRTLRLYMKGTILVPFIATVLFIAHPIHTEVVANIKGRDDILSFLFFVATAYYVFRFSETQKNRTLIFAAICFFLSFLSKESAITFVAVIPLMLWFFTDAGKQVYLKTGLMLVSVTALSLLIRFSILGFQVSPVPEVDNYLACLDGFGLQRANAIFILGIYFLKLFIPYPLVCDRSIHDIPVIGFGSWEFWLSFLIYATLAVYALMKFKSKDRFVFCILFFFATISIVSNIPFHLGTNYGERLLYTPSLAFCMAAAYGLAKLAPAETNFSSLTDFFRTNGKASGALLILVFAFGFLTINRNSEWENNNTLYTADLAKAPGSAKLYYYLAAHITLDAELNKFAPGTAERKTLVDSAAALLKKSISIYPEYTDANSKLAQMFVEQGKNDSADLYFRKAITLLPSNAVFHNNYGTMLFSSGKLDAAKKEFESAIKYNPAYAHALHNLSTVYGTEASNLVMAGQRDSSKIETYYNEARSKFQTSLTYSIKALQYDPDYVQAYLTTAVTYGNLGDKANQQKYQALAEQAKARAAH